MAAVKYGKAAFRTEGGFAIILIRAPGLQDSTCGE